jgi:hypothetical protein
MMVLTKVRSDSDAPESWRQGLYGKHTGYTGYTFSALPGAKSTETDRTQLSVSPVTHHLPSSSRVGGCVPHNPMIIL